MSKTFPSAMARSGLHMVENLQVYDMVWGMAHINRFTGKGDRQVNVLAHCLHCFELALIWQPENHNLQLYALTHDLPEAYYGDFPGFLKPLLGPDFEDVLARIDDCIYPQLGLAKDVRVSLHADLKRIDENALALEAEYAFDKFEPYHWPKPDLYDELDIIKGLTCLDDIALYNLYSEILTDQGKYNEVLRDLLYRHRTYSHPVRVRNGGRIPPCSGHAFAS